MSKRDPRRIWLLAVVGLVLLAITYFLLTRLPFAGWLDSVTRGAALFAYMSLFLAVVSSNFMVELVRFFGNPFVRIHHVTSITSLVLITLHPLGVAYSRGTLSVFLPTTGSWYGFFVDGGRPAFWLFLIAALAASRRGNLRRAWRYLHWLTYVAFLFATVHGTLLGITFGFAGVRYTAYAMATIVLAVFLLKRVEASRRRTRARSRRDA